MDYKASFDGLSVIPAKVNALRVIVDKINANKDKYRFVANETTVPWYVIAAIHYRESSLGFKSHLHNGDPLTGYTTHVPSGRPLKGHPPFTWEYSAVDALTMKRLDRVEDWSIENTLKLLERYNGLGYKNKGLPSPYIWSWTPFYQKGKYVEDGKFDPDVVDKQCGVAAIIKSLL